MSRRRFNNQKIQHYLDSLPQENEFSAAKGCLSVSFRFFDRNQPAGQDFSGWTEKERLDLLNKIAEYTNNTKSYWLNQRCGSEGLRVLAVYGDFPVNSDFRWPDTIPKEGVCWARFRLSQKVRTIGFFVDEETARNYSLSTDTFYLVFLDKYHRFYKTEQE